MELIYTRMEGCTLVALNCTIYFLIATVGALIKDIYNTKTGVCPEINIQRILVSSILSMFLVHAAKSYVGENVLPVINFILGLIGFELFKRISTIDGLKKTIQEVKEIILDIITIRNSYNNETNTNLNNDAPRPRTTASPTAAAVNTVAPKPKPVENTVVLQPTNTAPPSATTPIKEIEDGPPSYLNNMDSVDENVGDDSKKERE